MILNSQKSYSRFINLLIFILVFLIPKNSHATDFPIHHNPQSYILTKLQTNDIVFLGTRHKQPPILEFISDIITELHNSGVTHIGLEIASNQQGKIDQFMKTGAGLNDIQIYPQIDCPEYRHLLNVIRELDPKKRLIQIALDLPISKRNENISRDEWMAKSIAGVFESNSNAKMLVVVGNNHVLKKLDWQDQVIDMHRSIREYLTDRCRNPINWA